MGEVYRFYTWAVKVLRKLVIITYKQCIYSTANRRYRVCRYSVYTTRQDMITIDKFQLGKRINFDV